MDPGRLLRESSQTSLECPRDIRPQNILFWTWALGFSTPRTCQQLPEWSIVKRDLSKNKNFHCCLLFGVALRREFCCRIVTAILPQTRGKRIWCQNLQNFIGDKIGRDLFFQGAASKWCLPRKKKATETRSQTALPLWFSLNCRISFSYWTETQQKPFPGEPCEPKTGTARTAPRTSRNQTKRSMPEPQPNQTSAALLISNFPVRQA